MNEKGKDKERKRNEEKILPEKMDKSRGAKKEKKEGEIQLAKDKDYQKYKKMKK